MSVDTHVRMEVVVIVRADMPDTAAGTNVVVRVPMPRSAVSVNTEVRAAAPSIEGYPVLDSSSFLNALVSVGDWLE